MSFSFKDFGQITNINIPDGKEHVEKTKFQGSPYFNVIVMYFLSHKHDDICVILSEPYETDESKNIHFFEDEKDHSHDDSCVLLPKNINHIPEMQREVSLRWVEQKNGKGFISVPKPEHLFWKNFTKCSSKRFVVMPFGYDCLDSGHANYLLYDKKNKTLERFESYGRIDDDRTCLNPPKLDKKIRALFEKNLGKDFIKKYYSPGSYLPDKNIQTLQENEKEKLELSGFCAVWSCFWIDLRLSNPDVDRKDLIKMTLKELKRLKEEKGISYTQFIRNYSGLIVDVSNEIKKLYK